MTDQLAKYRALLASAHARVIAGEQLDPELISRCLALGLALADAVHTTRLENVALKEMMRAERALVLANLYRHAGEHRDLAELIAELEKAVIAQIELDTKKEASARVAGVAVDRTPDS